MTIQRHFKLALTAGHTIPLVINANQYDSGEQWLFTLYNDGVRYTPSSGAIVGIKADRLGIINTGTVDANGRVVINETRQMTAAVGKNIFELLIDDQTHGTANFMVLVEPRPGDNADLSESDYSLFEEAIQGTSQAAIKAGVQEWMDENLTDPTDPIVDASLSLSGAAADAKKTGDEISALKSAIAQGGGFNAEVKQALMNAFNHVAWDDDDPTGITYINALHSALYPPANLTSITAVYTQVGEVYTTDSLDVLRDDLVVTANYDNGTTETITDYILSGALTEGTSTITASYGGKTATFTVTVTDPSVLSWMVEYQGNFTNSTPSNTRVTLISSELTFNPGDVLTATAATGYKIFAIPEYATHGDDSLNRTPNAVNKIYINAETSTGYLPSKGSVVVGTSGSLLRISQGTWTSDGGSITHTYADTYTSSLTIGGLSFYVEKIDGSDITIAEAESALTIS